MLVNLNENHTPRTLIDIHHRHLINLLDMPVTSDKEQLKLLTDATDHFKNRIIRLLDDK